MSLLDRHVEFVVALRRAGLPVSVAEDLDAAAALRVIDMLDRVQLRASYAAALMKRQAQRGAFDTLFDLYFPAARGAGDEPAPDTPSARMTPELQQYRAQLGNALLSGDDAELSRMARTGVARYGAVAASGSGSGGQAWSGYAARNRISAQTLLAGLLEQALYGRADDDSGLGVRAARTRFAAGIARFERLLDTEVQRRQAEITGAEQVARTAVRPSVDRIDLLSATRADLYAIRREIQPLARRLAARLAIEHRRGRRGQLDFRRTIRSSLSSGGVPVDTVHRPRHPKKTDLVILCDVSESVTAFAHFTLLLIHAMREQFTRVRVFAFIDDVDEVSKLFRPGADVVESVTRLAAEANVRGWYGRTDYGRVFGLFAERHLDAITTRTSLLVLGDARSNYGDLALPALRWIASLARRAYWLNPERRVAWDTGDSAAAEVGEIVPMVECRNLAQLGQFVRDLV